MNCKVFLYFRDLHIFFCLFTHPRYFKRTSKLNSFKFKRNLRRQNYLKQKSFELQSYQYWEEEQVLFWYFMHLTKYCWDSSLILLISVLILESSPRAIRFVNNFTVTLWNEKKLYRKVVDVDKANNFVVIYFNWVYLKGVNCIWKINIPSV